MSDNTEDINLEETHHSSLLRNPNPVSNSDPYIVNQLIAYPSGVRAKLAKEIMRKADILVSEGSQEKASGMYDVGIYILTGSWEW